MTGLFRPVGSLPLDGADGLGGQVQEDAVDAFDFVGDAVGDVVQQSINVASDSEF